MSLDIFSKSRQKAESKREIIVDFREKNSLVPSFLVKIGCKVRFIQLEVGDYKSGSTIIERKTFSDLQSSIIDKRIFVQISNLKRVRDKMIIIEGEKEKLRISQNAIRGLILFAVKNSSIPVIFSENEEETANYIRLLAEDKKSSEISLRSNTKFNSKEERLRYILEGFPGIGPAGSKKLLARFKSLRKIINASEEELNEILGSKTQNILSLID